MSESPTTFDHLNIALPESIIQAYNDNIIGDTLFVLLKNLDTKAQWIDQKNNMRIEMIQNAVKEGLQELESGIYKDQPLSDRIIKLALISKIELVMAMELGDEGGKYKDNSFNHLGDFINIGNSITHKSLPLCGSGNPIYIWRVAFIKQYLERYTRQEFIPWVQDESSINFIVEYYNYICNPLEYPGTTIKNRYDLGDNGHRRPITPEVLKNMEERLGFKISDTAVSIFFEYHNKEYKPTHDLVCQMAMIAPGNAGDGIKHPIPHLSTSHLGNPEDHIPQFEYYSKLLVHTYLDNKDLSSDLASALQELIIMIETKPSLLEHIKLTDGDIDCISDTIDSATLIRLGIIESPTPMIYELTIRGALLLYMCCPKIS